MLLQTIPVARKCPAVLDGGNIVGETLIGGHRVPILRQAAAAIEDQPRPLKRKTKRRCVFVRKEMALRGHVRLYKKTGYDPFGVERPLDHHRRGCLLKHHFSLVDGELSQLRHSFVDYLGFHAKLSSQL